MSETMSMDAYLGSGGKLTSPDNVPPRYRAELLRLMATFVDSALAGAAGFAEQINAGPGVKARIAAARIVMEKMGNADRVLGLMAEFGANTDVYVIHHPWTERLSRDSDIGASRRSDDMRLSVFHYPLEGWTDAVIMNVLMGHAVVLQLDEFSTLSYQPLAEAFQAIAKIETEHLRCGQRGLEQIAKEHGNRELLRASVDYWRPRVQASFGSAESARFEQLRRQG
jgi:ring-1,2-phenylacetyl-CoA epoxidase subunit PaaA